MKNLETHNTAVASRADSTPRAVQAPTRSLRSRMRGGEATLQSPAHQNMYLLKRPRLHAEMPPPAFVEVVAGNVRVKGKRSRLVGTDEVRVLSWGPRVRRGTRQYQAMLDGSTGVTTLTKFFKEAGVYETVDFYPTEQDTALVVWDASDDLRQELGVGIADVTELNRDKGSRLVSERTKVVVAQMEHAYKKQGRLSHLLGNAALRAG
jgi:hypothetical protein